jgi:two-component system, OmpR family, phosphate regulon response regulator PhoB
MARVCVVEDDRAQRLLLTVWLESQGHAVSAYSNPKDALKVMATGVFELIILDWNLPDIPGDLLLHRIRKGNAKTPIIFQTVHDNEDDIVRMLDAGADDFLVKPLAKSTLMARVRAVLRRSKRVDEPVGVVCKIGATTLNSISHTIRTPEQSLACGDKEFAIAWYLAHRIGQIVLRQQLLSDIWDRGQGIETRTVDMYVSRLRSALRSAGISDWRIQSVYGTGYRLEVSNSSDS